MNLVTFLEMQYPTRQTAIESKQLIRMYKAIKIHVIRHHISLVFELDECAFCVRAVCAVIYYQKMAWKSLFTLKQQLFNLNLLRSNLLSDVICFYSYAKNAW